MDKYNEKYIDNKKYPYIIPSSNPAKYFKIGSMLVQNLSTARGCTLELSFIGLLPPNYTREKTIRFNIGLSFYGNSTADGMRINYRYDTRESNSFTNDLTDITFDTTMIQFAGSALPGNIYQVDVYTRSDTLITLGFNISHIVTAKSEFVISKTMNIPVTSVPASTITMDVQKYDLNKLNNTAKIQQTGVGFGGSYGAMSVISDYLRRKREYVGRVQLTTGQTLAGFVIDNNLPIPANTNTNMKFITAVEYSDGTFGYAVLTLTTAGALQVTSVDKATVTTTTQISYLHLTGVSYYF